MKIMELALFVLISIGTMAIFDTKAQQTKVISQEEASKKFIEEIGSQVVSILADKSMGLSLKQEKFVYILENYFEIPKISEFVLGRYWPKALPEQKEKYIKIFKNELVKSYSKKFEDYNKEKLQVTGVRKSKDQGVFVSSKIIRAVENAPALTIDWKIYETPVGLRIFDVFINGVSMGITYRNEHARLLSAQRGNIDNFLQALENHERSSEESAAS